MFLQSQVMACQNLQWKRIFEKCVFLWLRKHFFPSLSFPCFLSFFSASGLNDAFSLLQFAVTYFYSAALRPPLRAPLSWPKYSWRIIHCPEVLTIRINWEHVSRLIQIHVADQQASWDKLHVSKPELGSLCPKLHPFCHLSTSLWFLSILQPPVHAHCAHPSVNISHWAHYNGFFLMILIGCSPFLQKCLCVKKSFKKSLRNPRLPCSLCQIFIFRC